MKIPKHTILTFERSETAPNTYNLKGQGFVNFVYVTIKKPYSPKMINLGARYILTGYDQNCNKTLFTGLFSRGKGIYTGDHYTPQKSIKNHLIIVKKTPKGFIMHYFDNIPKIPRRNLFKGI